MDLDKAKRKSFCFEYDYNYSDPRTKPDVQALYIKVIKFDPETVITGDTRAKEQNIQTDEYTGIYRHPIFRRHDVHDFDRP